MNANHIFLLYWPARTLQAAVRLGIFDQLARGPQSSAQVAEARRLNPAATERLMQALVSMGWLRQHGLAYTNGPEAALSLVEGSPFYVGGGAYHHAEQLWPLWNHLETAVREGRSVVPEAFGQQSPFDLFDQSPEVVLNFLAGMHGGASGFGEMLASAWDFSRHRHLVDFGGATGAVSGPVARMYPHLQVTVLELPPVAAVLPPILAQYGVGGRIRAHAGDFFRPETYPTGFDAALLGRVLHNWGDDRALEILRNIAGGLPPGGVVLVMEHLKDSLEPEARAFTALSDLNMLVMTGNGRERTAAEFAQLFRLAGLVPLAPMRIGGSLAILAGYRPG